MRATGIFIVATAIMLVPSLAAADPAPAEQMSSAPAQPQAQTPVQPAAPAPTATASDVNLNAIVCKATAPATGTRLGGGRECRTVREWNEQQQLSRAALEGQQQRGLTAAAPGGGH